MSWLSFHIRTHHSASAAGNQIAALTRPATWRQLPDTVRPFAGSVQAQSFRIRQVDRFKHYLYPYLLGEIRPHGKGASVDVKVRPSVTAWVIFAVACGFPIYDGVPQVLALVIPAGLALLVFGCHVLAMQGQELMEQALTREVGQRHST